LFAPVQVNADPRIKERKPGREHGLHDHLHSCTKSALAAGHWLFASRPGNDFVIPVSHRWAVTPVPKSSRAVWKFGASLRVLGSANRAGVAIATCEKLIAERTSRHATYDMQRAACDVRHATCGMRRAACDVRHATCERQRARCNVRDATCAQHAACNMTARRASTCCRAPHRGCGGEP
jgi:hypothetical protein